LPHASALQKRKAALGELHYIRASRPKRPTTQETPMTTTLHINGSLTLVDADSGTPILWALRDTLGLTGTKFGCGAALCGACTVHVDGVATRSCVTPLAAVAGKQISTIEGMGTDPVGRAVQNAWVAHDVAQCGYCQSGQVMSATALLKTQKKPTDADIDAAMAGNICRCGTYARIRSAIHAAAAALA
jgi:isoquinoline 1-oxidoreductase alpha subunit